MLKHLKKLSMAIVSMALMIGVSAAPVLASATGETVSLTGNAYTLLDSKDKFVFGALWGYNEEEDTGINGPHSIIAFDDKEEILNTITRITVKIYWVSYANFWDEFFRVNKINNVDTYTISATDTLDFVSGAERNDAKHHGISGFVEDVPLIGRVEDIIEIEDINDKYIAYKGQYAATPELYSVNEITTTKDDVTYKFTDKDFYVILPVKRSYEDVFISIAGTDLNNDPISDGTNDGLPYTDPFGDYIQVKDKTASSVNFTSRSTIKYLKITNFSDNGNEDAYVSVKFGNYDYQDSKFLLFLQKYDFTANQMMAVDDLMIPYDYEGLVYFMNDATADVSIYYSSETPAVLVNLDIYGCGLQCEVEEPEPESWQDKLERLWNEFVNFIQKLLIISGILFLIAVIIWLFLKFIKPNLKTKKAE